MIEDMTFIRAATLGLALFAAAPPSQAGIYSDDMAKCLVSSTTDADRTLLVRWIFATTALHPDLATIASVTPAQRDAMNQDAAKLLERLLTVTCRQQTREALKNEGNIALQQSFQVLGQVAMRSMMTNPAVARGFESLGKHLDEKKMQDLSK